MTKTLNMSRDDHNQIFVQFRIWLKDWYGHDLVAQEYRDFVSYVERDVVENGVETFFNPWNLAHYLGYDPNAWTSKKAPERSRGKG